MCAAHYKLNNLTAFVDFNGLQIDGNIEDVMNPSPIDKKFEAFGWNVLVIDGHNYDEIIDAIEKARNKGLRIPVVYNTSAYENVETLRMLDGIVDVYLPDFKYMDSRLSQQYSYAADYTETAKKALEEMIRQTGKPVFFTAEDELVKEGYVEEQIMKRGVIVRHLLLPCLLYTSPSPRD